MSAPINGWDMLSNTAPFDMTGHPAISIPCLVQLYHQVGKQAQDAVDAHGKSQNNFLRR